MPPPSQPPLENDIAMLLSMAYRTLQPQQSTTPVWTSAAWTRPEKGTSQAPGSFSLGRFPHSASKADDPLWQKKVSDCLIPKSWRIADPNLCHTEACAGPDGPEREHISQKALEVPRDQSRAVKSISLEWDTRSFPSCIG